MRNYKRKSKKSRKFCQNKATNKLRQKVRQIGGDKFGLLVVDSSKNNFAVKLADFYGEPLWEPDPIPNTKGRLEELPFKIRHQMKENQLQELAVGIEITGRLHQPVKRILEKIWPVKMIHPFTTKQLRQPASFGVKTDDVDLDAMIRAMISGYGRDDCPLPISYQKWQCLNRAREDLVKKRSEIKTQCQEHIQALMPGYSRLFKDFWSSETALTIVTEYGSPEAILKETVESIFKKLKQQHVRCLRRTLHRIYAWALEAPVHNQIQSFEHRILCDYLKLIRTLSQQIHDYEKELLEYLVKTSGILLLSIAGVNIVSSSGYVSELGPIENYPTSRHISGRAGLFPSCYQSDEVNHRDGPIVKGHNARLRDAILEIAFNILNHDNYFKAWAELRKKQGWEDKKIIVAMGNRFTRFSFYMVADSQLFNHPKSRHSDPVLAKILRFCADHNMTPESTFKIAQEAVGHFPVAALDDEIKTLEAGQWRSSGSTHHYGLPRTSTIKQIAKHLPDFIGTIKAIQEERNHEDVKETNISIPS